MAHGNHFADTFKWPSMKMCECCLKISLAFVPWGLMNNIPSLVQIMARLPTRICVTRPQC